MPDAAGADFASRVCAAFGLPGGDAWLRPLPASSTRLWELRVGRASGGYEGDPTGPHCSLPGTAWHSSMA